MLPGWDEHDSDFWWFTRSRVNCPHSGNRPADPTRLLCYVIEKSQRAWIIFFIDTLVVAALSLNRINGNQVTRLRVAVWFPTGQRPRNTR